MWLSFLQLVELDLVLPVQNLGELIERAVDVGVLGLSISV